LWTQQAVPATSSSESDALGNHSVAVDAAGNAYTTGMLKDTLTFGAFTLSGYGINMYLAKYDINGNAVWATQSNSNGIWRQAFAYGNSVAVNANEETYVSGWYYDSIKFGSILLTCPVSNFFLTKYDPNGNLLWAKQPVCEGGSLGYGCDVVLDASGNAYATGFFSGTVSFGSFTLKVGTHVNSAVFVAKYDPNGNVIWATQSEISGRGYSLALDNSGNVYVTGIFQNNISFGSVSLVSSGNSMFLVKYDINGNVIWARQPSLAGSNSAVYSKSMAVDASGGIYVTGYFFDTVSFATNILSAPQFAGGAFLTKYDTSGNVIWVDQGYNIYGNSIAWQGFSVVCNASKQGGGYLTLDANNYGGLVGPPVECGITFGTKTFSLPTQGTNAGLIVEFDSAGNVICGDINFEGNEDDGDGVGVDPSGSYIYISGDIFYTGIPGQLPNYYEEFFISRWQPCFIPYYVSPYESTCVYVPNAFSPNGDHTNDIEYVYGGACITSMDFIIYDRWGNKIFESKNPAYGWDGTYKGQAMNTGSFAYYLTALLQDGTAVTKKGNITLVR